MLKSKQVLIGGSIAGVFILVYGSAIVFRLLMGNYVFDNGLANPNYVYLVLLCSLPFVIVGIIRLSEINFSLLLISWFLFAFLFIVIHWTFVFSGEQITGKETGRILTVLPISALLIVAAARTALSLGNAESKLGLFKRN